MNLEQKTRSFLSESAFAVVQSIGRIAAEIDQPVCLVGGGVRDILLGRLSNDLDFVTIGSAIELAQIVCQQLGGELAIHERFGTAVWHPPPNIFTETVDLITARKERYPAPAALPEVTPSHMDDDLFRRDFTINALALELKGETIGRLLDPFDGEEDLAAKQIKILHLASFKDDPTRIFRALRYAGRLGFELEGMTRVALLESILTIALLSADRVRHEIEKILAERLPMPILESLEELVVLSAISPSLIWQDQTRVALSHLDGGFSLEPGITALKESTVSDLRLATWLTNLPNGEKGGFEIADRLNVSSSMRRNLEEVFEVLRNSAHLGEDVRPGTLEQLFRGLSASQLAILQANQLLNPTVRDQIRKYFTEWRLVKITTDGHRLKQKGVSPGPIYKQILDQLLAETLNGEINTSAEEEKRLAYLLDKLPVDNKKSAS